MLLKECDIFSPLLFFAFLGGFSARSRRRVVEFAPQLVCDTVDLPRTHASTDVEGRKNYQDVTRPRAHDPNIALPLRPELGGDGAIFIERSSDGNAKSAKALEPAFLPLRLERGEKVLFAHNPFYRVKRSAKTRNGNHARPGIG